MGRRDRFGDNDGVVNGNRNENDGGNIGINCVDFGNNNEGFHNF